MQSILQNLQYATRLGKISFSWIILCSYYKIFFQWFEQNEMQIIFYREIAIYGVC